MATVVTDLYPHRMWLRGRPDLFCVPSDWSKEILLGRRPKAEAVVTGIPISSEFRPSVAHGPRRVLVTSGGISGGPVLEVVRALARLPLDLHVVTGWNESLRHSLEEDPALAGVTVLGHLDQAQMAEAMGGAALIVGKPGGLTTMESLAVGTPFVVFKPFMIPGQEERNAQFLSESGAGIGVGDVQQLCAQVATLLDAPDRLASMRAAAAANGRPDAAANVVRTLEAR
jgi:processive 1,2-diacylglycerol beta-glucosyltransferase